MKLSVTKERLLGEKRVATTPNEVKKLSGLGFRVFVEKGAGLEAGINDQDYQSAGAEMGSLAEVLKDADVIFKVRAPELSEISYFKKGAIVAALLNPYQEKETLKALAAAGVTAVAIELIPRITRAQSMDVLSSQANIAGYRAVLEATAHFGRSMPMMMTAAGTIAPAKVFVMGAGVAGLQAIATARRLGAVVSATDVRMAAKEQVQSLGASFVMVENDETRGAETSGGYAKEMSDEYKRLQAELVAETIKKQDIVITTALIPGRKAPELVTAAMVESMRKGSVIVDMAAEMGGNCALTKKGEVITHQGVTIVGHDNFPSLIAVDASALYARNLSTFASLLVKDKALLPAFDDEILKASVVIKDGQFTSDKFQ